jgi:hypothetical protein
MIIKELKIYGTKSGWRCEDSSSVNVAELKWGNGMVKIIDENGKETRDYRPWEWQILGDRDNDYCRYDSFTSYRDSETLVIDRETDAQGNDIYWLHSADSEWGDPSELYQCEYEMWEEAERMLKEGAFKRVVNYTMGIGHFIDMLNDLNKCRKKETTLSLNWKDVEYNEYDCYEWDDDDWDGDKIFHDKQVD